MTGWAAKRFWTDATVEACPGGHTVRLDGRQIRTPAKAPLILPTAALAEAVAVEWRAQTGVVDPATMPCTRTANSAIDKLSVQFDAVADMLADYGGTDLLCYRATTPPELVARQAAAWDPLLDWAGSALGAPLHIAAGVIPVPQPEPSLGALKTRVAGLTPFQLAAFHDLVAISGSLILGFAVTARRLTPEAAWTASRIDETWQAEQWGSDDDAARDEAIRKAAFLQADRFFGLCG
ncbi:MAG: ATPase [Tabrizicola sp.]|nr:ATPase [Tabrizicola sp.]